jgi:hypothetical protein
MKNKYFCHITEVNGEYEYTSNFLMEMDEGKEDEQFESVLLSYRGDGEYADDKKRFVWYSDALAAENWGYKEIPEEDFTAMRKYLSVLGAGD